MVVYVRSLTDAAYIDAADATFAVSFLIEYV